MKYDYLSGIPEEDINRILRLSGFGNFIARTYSCDQNGHIIDVSGSSEDPEHRIHAEFTMKIYSLGSLVYTRMEKVDFIIDEETLQQNDRITTYESELNHIGHNWEAKKVTTNHEGEIVREENYLNGEIVEEN